MNSGTSARKTIDVLDSRSYETGYTTGYRTCQLDYNERERERWLYFLKQKAVGVFLLLLTILAIKLLDGDATIALLTIPLGLMLIFSKEKWLIE